MIKSILSKNEKSRKVRALAKLMDSKNARKVLIGPYLDFFDNLLNIEE
ncbi:MAG: hypothetical protein GY864_00520, partial [Desulfobacterales bacterium]|nr:hypothetical protein [Desulfobacterales bacterium]